jgi:hypothetical protein
MAQEWSLEKAQRYPQIHLAIFARMDVYPLGQSCFLAFKSENSSHATGNFSTVKQSIF